MGFASVSEYAAADEAGQVWISSFRKVVASSATTTSAWIDYTYFAGSPAANFYASAPLTAALVEADKGIYTGGNVSPATKHIKNLQLMSAASAAASTANGRQQIALCDYLLCYPFIDTDAISEAQALDNTVALPRYAGGQVVAVAQSAASTVGQFTFTYTNQDGVAGRVSQNNFTFVVAGGGQVVNASGAGASYNPFCYLQAGDTAVRSIESVTMSAAGGGLMCLVIVKPLLKSVITEECRTNSAAFGSCTELATVIHQAGAPRVQDGAVLGLLASGYAGSLASSILAGALEVAWR
jgi:hypothetical protein